MALFSYTPKTSIKKNEIDFGYTLVAPAYMYCANNGCFLKDSPFCESLLLYDFNDYDITTDLGNHILSFFKLISGIEKDYKA